MKEQSSITLRDRFTPAFWDEADGRSAIVKEIKRRVSALKEDTGADSAQKRILCERAAFLALRLESMEREGIDKGKIDLGVYTQATNALVGLLKALGLEKKLKTVNGLKAYLNGRGDS